jgi:trigger factor
MAPATDEKKKLEPKAELAEVGPCKLKVRVEVEAPKVHEKIEEKYRELGQTAELPGFRKGHAPRALLERKYGKAVLEDLKFELLNSSFEEVKEAKQLEPLGEPDIDVEKVEIRDGAPLVYEITVEVKPKVEVKRYAGLTVKKIEPAVTDADLDEELKNLREERAELVPHDGPAEKEDQVICDFELRVDGAVKQKIENNALVLNERISFHGAQLPDFHKAIVGKKAGDAVEYPITLPADHPDKTLAGKQGTIAAKLKSVKRRRLPELDAAFAKSFDMDSIEELKEDLRKHLLRQKEREGRRAQAEQILEQIVKENDFPLPEGLVDANTREAEARLRTELLMRGAKEEEVEEAIRRHTAESREAMIRNLKERFVLEHIAQKEKIYVTEEEIDDRIQAMASQTGRHPHEMRAYLEEHELLAPLRRSLREEAVRELLLSKATVE